MCSLKPRKQSKTVTYASHACTHTQYRFGPQVIHQRPIGFKMHHATQDSWDEAKMIMIMMR